MALNSSRRGVSTIHYNDSSLVILPSHWNISKLERELKMNWLQFLDELARNPFLLIDFCFYLQAGTTYSKDEINDWLLGDMTALQPPIFVYRDFTEEEEELSAQERSLIDTRVKDEDGTYHVVKPAGSLYEPLKQVLAYAAGSPYEEQLVRVIEKKAA